MRWRPDTGRPAKPPPRYESRDKLPLMAKMPVFSIRFGGEGGIRTPDRLAPMPHFECGAFDHSATSPRGRAARATHAVPGARGVIGHHFGKGKRVFSVSR